VSGTKPDTVVVVSLGATDVVGPATEVDVVDVEVVVVGPGTAAAGLGVPSTPLYEVPVIRVMLLDDADDDVAAPAVEPVCSSKATDESR
jgi:hypothetical protein